jgi:2-methylisocitrate lyase-like PEP mutase family enzyme
MPKTRERAELFARLHQREDKALILPNAWDAGSARMLEAMGFEAIATTSAGYAFSQGKCDWPGEVSRDEAMAHCKSRATAVHPERLKLLYHFGIEHLYPIR